MNSLRRSVCFLLFLASVCCAEHAKAQDLIVTITNDSLNVKIHSESDRFVYYTNSTSKEENLVMSKKQVADIVYGFYSDGALANEPNEVNYTGGSLTTEKTTRFQISASLGYSRLLALVDEDSQGVKEYYQQLLNGYNYSFQVNYLFSKYVGVGFMFERSHFENSVNNVTFTSSGGTSAYGTLSDDMTLTYIGPNFVFRIPFKRSGSAIQFEFGMGYSSYRNIGEISSGYEVNASFVGLSLGAMYQLNLGGGLFVPLKIGVKNAIFPYADLKVDSDMPEDFEYELESGIEEYGVAGSRLELSVGLLYSF